MKNNFAIRSVLRRFLVKTLESLYVYFASLEAGIEDIVGKIRILDHPTAIKSLEAELTNLEKDMVKLKSQKQELENKQPTDLKPMIAKLKHLLGHFNQVVKTKWVLLRKLGCLACCLTHSPRMQIYKDALPPQRLWAICTPSSNYRVF